MPLIPFRISARTAKLIGRENFSNPEGAIIELVKNSYDADATDCIVVFDIQFENVPLLLSTKEYREHSKKSSIVKTAYQQKGKEYLVSSSLKQEGLDSLKDYFFANNSIYVIDNGHGMLHNVVENQWMEIGTGNKEEIFTSEDGRVKTGAKGIGRFALDRLGLFSEMWTVPKEKNSDATYWKMDWRQFDFAKKRLDEINAEIEVAKVDLKQFIRAEFKDKQRIIKKINEINFSSGTVIKISSLKDNWYESSQENVFKSLESLVPPKELAIPFGVSFYSLKNLKLFGEIDTAFFNEFDYKVDVRYDAKKLVVTVSITRNELDLKEVKGKFSHLFKDAKPPYDLRTLAAKKFDISKSAFELIKWEKDNSNTLLLRSLGDCSFSFYFLKNTSTKDYPYRDFNSSERQKVLKRFGGIKIYRDSFRVRPYGDMGNDWLKLGDRAAQSPAGAGQRIGDWRVGPNQIAGLVKISRVDNPHLVDKSDRGALIENEAFGILKKIITESINVFEIDRSTILNRFFLDSKEQERKKREDEIRAEAEILADKIIKERAKVESKIYGSRVDLFRESKNKQEKESYKKLIEEGFQKFERREEDDAEIAQVRTLASLGLIISSFAHELKEVKNNVDDIEDLEKIYKKIAADEFKKQQVFTDGINIIDSLKLDNKRIAHWVEYSLTAIKKDKRKRTSLKFDVFFNSLQKQWDKVLNDRKVKLSYKDNVSKAYLFRAFEMDMSTIFSNLISNSIDAFNNLKELRGRKINITTNLVRNNIEISYTDNGTGLPKVFQKNKEQIFLPFTTSKKDKEGNDIGTGLGMYLVKNVVTDNNGVIDIIDTTVGFKIKIKFPIRNK